MKNLIIIFHLFFFQFTFSQKTEKLPLRKFRVAVLSDSLKETSGLTFLKGKLYTFNDSGNSNEIFEIDTASGKILKKIKTSFPNKDWEAMTNDGELLQLEKARKLDITEDVYYEIIRQKTATLIAACCEIGVLSNNADEHLAKKMQDFGTYTGIAFQIKDDLFDYLSKNIIGKPVGIDIKEQKMTLPLIYTLRTAKEIDRKYFFNTIKRYNNDQKRVKELIEFVKKSGGLDYAIGVMKDFQQKAKDILAEFPDSEAKHSLNLMLDYVIERKF